MSALEINKKYIYDNVTEYDPQQLAKEINDSFNKIKPLPNPPQQGWECPKCGSVYAPFMPVCTRCGECGRKSDK